MLYTLYNICSYKTSTETNIIAFDRKLIKHKINSVMGEVQENLHR